jgi:hypothetical protein
VLFSTTTCPVIEDPAIIDRDGNTTCADIGDHGRGTAMATLPGGVVAVGAGKDRRLALEHATRAQTTTTTKHFMRGQTNRVIASAPSDRGPADGSRRTCKPALGRLCEGAGDGIPKLPDIFEVPGAVLQVRPSMAVDRDAYAVTTIDPGDDTG